MLNIKLKNKFLLIILLYGCLQIPAQNHLSSPYSRFGIGEQAKRTSSSNMAVGGVSHACQSQTTVNSANPASYIAFDSMSCIIDAAFSYKYHKLQETSIYQKGSSMNFDYLSLGFSVARKWKTAIGFQPYSFINYTINEATPVDDSSEINYNYIGSGGIYELYWGNAFQLFKNFSLGLNISYLFGNSYKQQTVEFTSGNFLNFKKSLESQINGTLFTIGSQYFIPIKQSKLGIGIVYTPSIPSVFSNQTEYLISYQNSGTDETIIDSLYWEGTNKVAVRLPQTVGAGVSWSSEKYFLGFDFTWSEWSTFAIGNIKDTLKNSYKISLGGSIIPNPTSAKYFPKIRFSAGYFFEQTSLYLKEKQINRFGINFGMSFPMKKNKTRLNLNMEYGQWGTLQQNLLKEQYFIVSVNVNLHEKWYQRRKLD